MGARRGPILELIEPIGGEVDFYRRALPDDGYSASHHPWRPTCRSATTPGSSMRTCSPAQASLRLHGPDPGPGRAGYVDTTAELGHYLEVCQLQPADTDFFSALAS